MKKLIVLLVVISACLMMVATPSFAQSADGHAFPGAVDASMYATGDNITVTIGNYGASYWNEISLYTYSDTGELSVFSTGTILAPPLELGGTTTGTIGTNQANRGRQVSFTGLANGFSSGTEIVLGVSVYQSQSAYINKNLFASYYSGNAANYSGSKYAKATAPGHSKVSFVADPYFGEPTLVGFEDLSNLIPSGAEPDYNDVTGVGITGVRSVKAVPEASTLIGFGSALAMAAPGMVGWLRRRRA